MNEVKHTKEQWRKIERRLSKLDALEAGGVDNWEWYFDSLSEWKKENQVEDLADEFLDNINDLSVEAEVDYPAGREAGASVTMPQDEVRNLFLNFLQKAKDL